MSRHQFVNATLLSAMLAGSVASMASMAGCADDAAIAPGQEGANPFASAADFVAVPREVDEAARARRAQLGAARKLPPSHGNEDFYLAIRKSELSKRYFLSAFIDQSFPGGFNSGLADLALDSRVVTFRVQNGKLFVFDAGDGKAPSDTFDPEVLVEAYPILQNVQGYGQMAGADDYVIFDPSAGLNRFSAVSDLLASKQAPAPTRFQVDLSYLQRFRQLADGVAYQQVFTGYAETRLDTGALDTNAFQSSGTLSISLRKYAEGAGFVPLFDDEHVQPPFFFANDPQLVKNEGRTHAAFEHWNIHPGMRPIRWLISRELVDFVAAHPELYAGTDVVAAVKKGIEGWNAAFGFTVLEVRIAQPGDTFSDDDKNFFVFDADPTAQFALATSRVNPNTAETRGANIYFPFVFIDPSFFSDDPPASTSTPGAPASLSVQWDALAPHVLCSRDASELRGALAADRSLTAGRKLELYVQHVVAHEIGHTLGLRHNFKGSLVPPTTSIMDYLRDPLAIANPTPGSYDVAAVRFLYGLTAQQPTQPFCTDEDIATDPLCAQKDNGADPLVDYWAPRFVRAVNGVQDDPGFPDAAFDDLSQGVLSFVRAGAASDPARAWEIAMAGVRAPIAPERLAADPSHGATADRVSRLVFDFLLGAGSKVTAVKQAPTDPVVLVTIVSDLRGNLLDLDGVRSFATRRLVVDVLKKLQRVDAHQVLLETRGVLAAQLASGGLDAEQASLTADLLARVERAISPYFE